MSQYRRTPFVQRPGRKSQEDDYDRFDLKTMAHIDIINELINRWSDDQNDLGLLASIKVYFDEQRAVFKKYYFTGANISANGRMNVDYICSEAQNDSQLLRMFGKADIIEEFRSGYKLQMMVEYLNEETYNLGLVNDDAPASMANMIKLVQLIKPLVQQLDTNFGLWNEWSDEFIAANLRFGSVHYTKHTIRMLLELEKQTKGVFQAKRNTFLPDGRRAALLCKVLRKECAQHKYCDDEMIHADVDTEIFYNIRSFNDPHIFTIPQLPF